MSRWAVLPLALLLSGCATVFLAPSQKAHFQKASAFVDRAQSLYRTAPIFLAVGDACRRAAACFSGRTIMLSWELLNQPALDSVLAHELAHVILGHTGAVPQQELDANFLAVELLERVGDYSRPAAITAVFNYLASASVITPGHLTSCAERADLARRVAMPELACGWKAPLTAKD